MELAPIRVDNTGAYEAVTGPVDRIPDFDPDDPQHLWSVGLMFRVNPQGGGEHAFVLDHENMLAVSGIVCYHCERAWTRELDKQPCPGEPEE